MSMMKMKKKRYIKSLVLILVLGFSLVLAACRPGEEATPTAAAPTVDPVAATAAAATATPTQGAPTVLLAAGPEADPLALSRVQTVLEPLAAETSLQLVPVSALTPAELTENVRVVVAVAPGFDLVGLAAGTPGTQFVGIDQPALTPGPNLSLIGDPMLDEERQNFMAGYLTAVISNDNKIAGLLPSDIPEATQAVNAYVIGARFFCGICNPQFPPYNSFPQWESYPVGSSADTIRPLLNDYVNMAVEVIYVHAGLISPELLNALSDLGITVVGGTSPDMPRDNWAGTVVLDPGPALAQIWPDITAGTGGHQVPNSILLMDDGAGLISEGRMRLFEEMVAELEADLVLPETVP
jgi:basic membrane lipoprotein Med (substrate-binding protein (PBP1-ABC) superfamily)